MIPFKGRSHLTAKVCISATEIFTTYAKCIDIREFSTTSWRQIIGVVPQDPVLFTGTIASNIAFGYPEATQQQIEDAAREANCEFIWGMPKGFETESQLAFLSLAARV